MKSIDASNASRAARAHSSGFPLALRGMALDGGPRAGHHFGVRYCAIAVYVFIGFNGLAHILLSGLEAVAQDEAQHRFRRTAGELGKFRDAALLRRSQCQGSHAYCSSVDTGIDSTICVPCVEPDDQPRLRARADEVRKAAVAAHAGKMEDRSAPDFAIIAYAEERRA
jgi:hypothetical protein